MVDHDDRLASLDELVEEARALGATGLVWVRKNAEGAIQSSVKALGESALAGDLAAAGAGDGSDAAMAGPVTPLVFTTAADDTVRLELAIALAADYADSDEAERRERGDSKELGVGLSTYTEMCGLAPSRILGAILYAAGGWDAATIRCLPTGRVQVFIGTSPHGQGHATAWAMLASEQLGIPVEKITVKHGDTDLVPVGGGTYGSRSAQQGGPAVQQTSIALVGQASPLGIDVVGEQAELRFGGPNDPALVLDPGDEVPGAAALDAVRRDLARRGPGDRPVHPRHGGRRG